VRKIGILCVALALILALVIPSGGYAKGGPPFTPPCPPNVRPIVFIHGGAGTALQFESAFLRFHSNGYPGSHFFAFEYDSTFATQGFAAVIARLDVFVDSVLEETGADKVYMLGHSLGTFISQIYLSAPPYAAKVAKYVNLDGGTASALPGGVPTLALWAEIAGSGAINPPREIIGAQNVVIPGTYHVGVPGHPEAFAAMYEFFTGEAPATTDILPEPPGQVEIAGRALLYPMNIGVGDATMEVWEVDGATGYRIYDEPAITCTVSGSWYDGGNWGPFKVNGLKHYEIVLLREGYRPYHFYYEPFMRSNYMFRLMASSPTGNSETIDRSDNHSNLVIIRDNEFRSGDPNVDDDILEVNGVNVLQAVTPTSKAIIGYYVFDWHADGVSDLTQPIAYLHAGAFVSGLDFYMPAADPPDGTISVALTPRDGGGKTQVVNVPNWASSEHVVRVRFFTAWIQDITSWTEYVPGQAPGQQGR